MWLFAGSTRLACRNQIGLVSCGRKTGFPNGKHQAEACLFWIIPLPFPEGVGDIRARVMPHTYFLKNSLGLFLFLLVLGCGWVGAREDVKKEDPIAEIEKNDGAVEAAEEPKVEQAAKAPEAENEADKAAIDPDDEAAVEESEAGTAAVARPVSADPIQVYGWREKILVDGFEKTITAKLDTGAYTSSIHVEEKELFERDGKKWMKFIVTEPRKKNSPRVRLEAPLVRIARIKAPGGESETREVVRLAFKIGERKLRGDFTLNNRANMLAAVLIGRTTIKELGWIDPSRTNLADKKIMR